MSEEPQDRRGPRALDRVKDSGRERKSTIVEQWDDLEVYATPVTVADRTAVQSRLRIAYGEDTSDWPQAMSLLYMVIQKLEDEDGDPLFDWDEAPELARAAEANVIEDLTLWLHGVEVPRTVDDAKKE